MRKLLGPRGRNWAAGREREWLGRVGSERASRFGVGKRRVGHGPLRVGLGCELGFSFWIWAGFWVLVG